ncbi:MBL fold metallo-hydrolase [Streptomyces tremellae]|uniref:MBL fold metallo-hydrolase n=1 Tax=Streptomyces tremellae TaxID=1124239 RepID=A0ABP7DPL0_9ACTN
MCEDEYEPADDTQDDTPGKAASRSPGARGSAHPDAPAPSRRGVLHAIAGSAALTSVPLLGGCSNGTRPSDSAHPRAAAASTPASTAAGLSVVLLGTNGGPAPLAERYGISSALVVDGKTYVVDCGRGAVSQYLRAGLSMPSLAGIFLTHLHSDHVVDYFSFPLLSAGIPGSQGFHRAIPVYGPGPAGVESTVTDAPGRLPGTVGMTRLASQAYAASPTFFMAEKSGVDPAGLLDAHDVLPPRATGASATRTAPAMKPFTVMEDDTLRVTAVLVPHGAVYPAYAYRFDTDHGSVVFSGDTGPTPNVVALAKGAGLLVHETFYPAALPGLGLPEDLLKHIKAVHTDVAELGAIAASAGVGALATTHLSPGQRDAVSDAAWKRLLRDSARTAHYGGRMIAGTDLLRVPVTA